MDIDIACNLIKDYTNVSERIHNLKVDNFRKLILLKITYEGALTGMFYLFYIDN